MGLQMTYAEPDGGEHPESYWNIEEILITPRTKRARITFAGWHNQQMRLDGKPLIGNRQIVLSGDAYGKYFEAEGMNSAENIYNLCYRLAKEIKDILVDSFPPKEEKDWVYRGFFENVQDVLEQKP